MPNVLLPEHQASEPEVKETPVAEAAKPDIEKIAADLQSQADLEAAANKAANENPELSEEDAEALGKKAVDKAVEKALGEKPEGEGKAGKVAGDGDWAPNYKYKVLDQEKEIPEWARGAVTKENEAQIREVFEKADGLDHVKSKLGEERGARENLDMNFSAVKEEITNLVGWRDKNLGVFFEKVGLPKQKVAQWLLHELNKQDLPEDVQRVYNEHEAQQRRMFELEQENSKLSMSRDNDGVQARTHELSQVLADPNVSQLASAFDARVGKPGSFQQMVVRHGQAEWEASGHKLDLSPKEAVDQVLKILNLQSQAPSPEATPNETPKPVTAETKTKVVQHKKPVVLPNLGNGGNAPASKRIKSVDDIRKVYKEMSGQNNN